MDDNTRQALIDAQKQLLTARPAPRIQENVHRRTSAGLWARPFASESLGVDPSQIEEARAQLAAHGLGHVEWDKHGRPLITSEKQYRDVARACGIFTGRDGYGGVKTGREVERAKAEFRRAVERGDYDL